MFHSSSGMMLDSMNGICGVEFKRRDATHFRFDDPFRGMNPFRGINSFRGMNPTATIGYRYAISFAPRGADT